MARGRYFNKPIKKQNAFSERSIRSILYPVIERSDEDIYVVTDSTDTLYTLADTYYGSVNYYWIIGEANENLDRSTQLLSPGRQIRIPNPSRIGKILEDFDDLNDKL